MSASTDTAHAQTLLKGITLPDLETERGIKAGDFKLWPKIFFEGGYDSNVFNQDVEDPTPVETAPFMKIKPGFKIANPNYNNILFLFDVLGFYRIYFSDDDRITTQNGFGGQLALNVDFFPKGPFTIRLNEQYTRRLYTPNTPQARTYDVNYNDVHLGLGIHPGGGALEILLNGGFLLTKYDDFEAGDFTAWKFKLLSIYKFLPLTSFFLEADLRLITYATQRTLGGVPLTNVNSMPFKAYVGMDGYITTKLALHIKAGYGNSFHDSGESYNMALGVVDFSFKFTDSIIAQIGYAHDFTDSLWANYFVDDKIQFKLTLRFAQRVDINLDGSYSFRSYAPFNPQLSNASVSTTDRADDIVRINLSTEFNITRFFGINVGYSLTGVLTDFTTTFTTAEGESVLDYGGYIKHLVYGNITFRY